MTFISLVSLLALAHFAYGQCSPPEGSQAITINSQDDASALESCQTISGSIIVSSAFNGNLQFDGPQSITGDLTIQNSDSLTSVSSDSISSIGGTFGLFNLTLLSTLSFLKLTKVNAVQWSSLTALASTELASDELNVQAGVEIQNTFLSILPTINSAANLNINNNPRLRAVSSPLQNTGTLNLVSNGPSGGAELSFPDLTWAVNFTIVRSGSSLSLPSLAFINGSLTLAGNSLSTFAAPQLEQVGSISTQTGALNISNNEALSKVSLPLLNSVSGSLGVNGNDDLQTLLFASLTQIGGHADFSGNLSTLDLGELENVKGDLIISSSADLDCGTLEKLAPVVEGKLVCNADKAEESNSSTSTSSSASSSSTSSSSPKTTSSSATTASSSTSTTSSSAASPTKTSSGGRNDLGFASPFLTVIVTLVVFA